MLDMRTNGSALDDSEDFASLLDAQETLTQKFEPGQKISGSIIAITGDLAFLDIGAKVDGILECKDLLDKDGLMTAKVGDNITAWVTAVSAQEIRLSRMGGGVAALEDALSASLPVDGRIASVCKGGVLVDILGKSAFCPVSQLPFGEDSSSLVGRTLPFLILRVENRGRNIVVSHRAVLERERQENLDAILAKLKEGDVVEGRISRIAAFGAFLEIAPGVEGMIHISELTWGRITQVEEAVSIGDTASAKVLGISKNDKGQIRISLSRKQAGEDPWLQCARQLKAGDTVEGKVVRIADFGAFVEIMQGVDGLVHVSELSWKRVSKPDSVVQLGQSISVKIKDIDVAARRISLSLREAQGQVPASGQGGDTEQKDVPIKAFAKGSASGSTGFGVMAQALAKAMRKN